MPTPNTYPHTPMVPVSVQGQHPCTLRGSQASLPFFLGLVTSAASSHSAPSSSSMLDTFTLLCSVLVVPPDSHWALSVTFSNAHDNLTFIESCSNNPTESCPSAHPELPTCFTLLYHIFLAVLTTFNTIEKMYSSYISLAHPFHRYINSSSGAGTFA